MASCSPAVLIRQAASFQNLSEAELARVKTQGLCDLANKPSGGSLILLESGAGHIQLENGSGSVALE